MYFSRTCISEILCIREAIFLRAIFIDQLHLQLFFSKLFESVLLLKCEEYLSTCSNQFGFKKVRSTDLCIHALREYIEYYKNRNTSVCVTMLNATLQVKHLIE